MSLPKNFLWGASTSAYQVEGPTTKTEKAYPFKMLRNLFLEPLTSMYVQIIIIIIKKTSHYLRIWA